MGLEQLDLLQHLREERPHLEHVLGRAAFGDAQDRLLGPVHHAVDLVVEVEGDLGHRGTGPDQIAAASVLLDDVGVVLDVGGHGHHVHQAGEVGDAPHLVQNPVAAQLLREGDGVDGLVGVVQVPHGLEDGLVRRDVEVLRPDAIHDLVGGVLGEQHRSQDRLLRLARVGWDPRGGAGRRG